MRFESGSRAIRPGHFVRCLMMVFALTAPLFPHMAMAHDWPYDERADAQADIRQALAEARTTHRAVLLVFGANWCEDCRALDAALKRPHLAAQLARDFDVVKVDVGNFDHNLDLAQRYGNPIRNGIPAAAVLSADGQLLFATQAGELADARHMGDDAIARLFEQARQAAHNRTP